MRHLLFAAFALALLAACTSNNRHYRMGADGRFERVTPEAVRDEQQASLAGLIGKELGDGWMVRVMIPQLPHYELSERSFGDNWFWSNIDVHVRIVGREGADPAVAEAVDVDDLVRSQLWDKRGGRLSVTRELLLLNEQEYATLQAAATGPEIADPAPTPTASATPASEGAHASTPPAAGPRRYVVQEGDTLALISAVFYGSANEWRRIVDANPGLDPASLTVGRELIIP